LQLVDVIRSLRRHWRASLAIVLLSGVVLGLFLFTRSETRDPDRWRASAQILVPVRSEDGTLPEGIPPPLLYGQGALALSYDTTADALRRVGLDDSARGDVKFGYNTNEGGDLLTLSVTAPSQDQAMGLAEAYAGAYIAARGRTVAEGAQGGRDGSARAVEVLETRLREVEDELQAADPRLLELDTPLAGEGDELGAIDLPADTPLATALLVYERRTLLNRIESARQTYAESSAESLVPQAYANIVERPAPQQVTPELPSPLPPIGVAAGVGLLLALAVPVLLDRLDHSIRDPRAAGAAFAAPVLSTIPATSPAHLETLARPGSARDAAYRTLAAASIATDELPRAIVVTSPMGAMQDSVAANFAAALAGLGLRVALVATDPRQAWYADSHASGSTLAGLLTDAHAGRLNGQVRDSLVASPVANLRVLPPGDTDSETLLEGLPTVLDALAETGIDVTVIAAPAMLEEPAATILAWSTRSVLWVVESGQVTEHEAWEAADRLALAGASPFGVALIDAKG
jgi:Mrp family chromosome partitioning ATPase